MAYKIANIKWLRDQGWNISSSYASDLCPTYNEIVNEIPKDSITVNVSGTYSNNQLVCEKDITITDTCTCNQINVSITELNISADSALTQVGTITTNDCIPNVTYESTQPTWLSGVTYISNDIRIKCSENTTYNSRSGSVNVKMNGTTCSTVNVTQAGKPTPQTSVHITFTGLPSNLTSGGLSMTGSTYTAVFILAGPNAGNGTLSGIFSPSDSRRVMTFSGQFTSTSGGGNIVNACDGSSTSYKYAVYTASWNATTSTLNVTFGQCT